MTIIWPNMSSMIVLEKTLGLFSLKKTFNDLTLEFWKWYLAFLYIHLKILTI